LARDNQTFTFFAVLSYTLAVFLLVGMVIGTLTISHWWVLLLALVVGIGLTGASMQAARNAEANPPVTALTTPPPAQITAHQPVHKEVTEYHEPEKQVVAADPTDTMTQEMNPAEVVPHPEKPTDTPDDLTKIEGIGPKMSEALISQGVATYAKLATLSLDEIRETIAAGGARFAPSAESWAEQAGYAAKGDWDGLQALQDKLVSGRYPKD
jgi:predicted flap endonuclease-1-like 5' DNA nuclease